MYPPRLETKQCHRSNKKEGRQRKPVHHITSFQGPQVHNSARQSRPTCTTHYSQSRLMISAGAGNNFLRLGSALSDPVSSLCRLPAFAIAGWAAAFLCLAVGAVMSTTSSSSLPSCWSAAVLVAPACEYCQLQQHVFVSMQVYGIVNIGEQLQRLKVCPHTGCTVCSTSLCLYSNV